MDTKKRMRPIWYDFDKSVVRIIDQRLLPHELKYVDLNTVDDVIMAIQDMYVRGAPLIGVTGAYGVYLALKNLDDNGNMDADLNHQCTRIKSARPTAVNLAWAVDQVLDRIHDVVEKDAKTQAALDAAHAIAEMEVENCRNIGKHGVELIEAIYRQKPPDQPVNILTHCNAGWLACVEYGTATAPMYVAHDRGIPIHVWVDETRPLNQGSRLTAWELGQYGIAHSIVADNTGGHLMQHGMVDIVIVGTDRTTYTGDVANKIGTYLKALAAKDNHVPFWVALPSSTFDWTLRDGLADIPIELRNPDEVRYVQGRLKNKTVDVLVPPKNSPAVNYAFDVTPARLVTGFITEKGCCGASEAEIQKLFPETKPS